MGSMIKIYETKKHWFCRTVVILIGIGVAAYGCGKADEPSVALSGYGIFTIGDPNEADDNNMSDAYVSTLQPSQYISDNEINNLHFTRSFSQPILFKAEARKYLGLENHLTLTEMASLLFS